METLEIFLWIIILGNLANFFYALFKTPFLNFDKQLLWKLWVLFCFFLLIVFSIICYFHDVLSSRWIYGAIVFGLGTNLYSLSFVENEFKAVMENETHFFKVERIESGRIFGELNIANKDESFPAELVNASRQKYKIGDTVAVKVIVCTSDRLKVEPETA